MTITTDAPATTAALTDGPWRSLFGLSRQPGYQPGPRITLRDFHITAAATPVSGARWHAVLVVEGVRTTDHREIANGALGFRDLPLPLMFLPETSWGHDGARICGRIESIDRVNNQLVGAGTFDVGEDGAEAERLVTSQTLRWVSADLEVTESTLIEIGINLDELLYDDEWLSQLAADGYDWWERVDAGQIMGACYDEQTEILTERLGWVRFDALPKGERVATRNPKTGEFEWQEPFHYHHDEWDGPMYHFRGGGVQQAQGRTRHKGLDLLVTPNHRMLVISNKTGEQSFMSAEELASRKHGSYRIPAVSQWLADDVRRFRIDPEQVSDAECACGCGQETAPRKVATGSGPVGSIPHTLPGHGHGLNRQPFDFDGDDFAAFMGAWLSEGSCGAGKRVHISQQEGSKGYPLFLQLMERMFPGQWRHDGNSFIVVNARLVRWLRQFGRAPQKHVPIALKDFSARQLRIFLEHYIAGDGDLEGRRIYTSSPRMAGDLQEIAQKTGMWAVVTERENRGSVIDGRRIEATCPGYVVALRNRPGSRRAKAIHDWTVEVAQHKGSVRCVSVPNEALYVRRNGVPAWCGNTIVPFPAFPQAVIALESMALPETTADNGLPTLTSSAAYVDGLPPAEWFEDPQLDRPTKFRVEDSGRIFGHVAAWDTDHIGLPPGQKPPRSRNGYAYFRMGTVKAAGADGPIEVATGPISLGGGHANERLGWRGAVEHYDSTSSAVADVACGEDRHGIWVAGAVRPEVDGTKVRAARASRGLSGDWRWIGGNFELVAALVVNVPGFPIPDSLAASGEPALILPFERPRMGIVGDQPVSLVAAGMVREDPIGAALRAFGRKLAEHQAVIDTLRPLAAQTLLARAQGRQSA